MRSKGFTLFLEPKALYNSVEAAAVVPEDFEVPFGKAQMCIRDRCQSDFYRNGSPIAGICYVLATDIGFPELYRPDGKRR